LLNVHHIAFDGWSVGVFARELSVLYQAFLNGEPSPLPELSIQYVDFAAWQQQWMLGEVLQAQLDYWKERLGGSLPVLELPTDRPRPAVQTYNGGNVSFAFSKRLTDALNILSQKEDVTLFVTLLAAFKILLLRYTGQEDIRDDFFDLGGHSLLAVRLFAKIEKQFGKRLPLSTLFQARTVEQLARALQEEVSALHWSSLAPIEVRGSKAPLFLVHGAEGNVLLYRALAQHLSEDQPVYGLQSKGLNGKDDHLETVEEMARYYIGEIRALQPSGPYYLGGYFRGGTIALDMAQQLEAHGEHVPLVALFETYNPSAAPKAPSRLLLFFRWLQNVKYHSANLLLIPTERRWKFLSEKWKVTRERLRIRLEAWVYSVKRRQGSMDGLSYAHLAIKRVNDRAAIHYLPTAYSGRVVLFRPKEYFVGLNDPEFGWGDVLRAGLEVHQLPFYAKGMLVEPFVEVLAEELKLCLSDIGRQNRSATFRSAKMM